MENVLITLVHLWSGGELLIHKSTLPKLAGISSIFPSCHILSRSISLKAIPHGSDF